MTIADARIQATTTVEGDDINRSNSLPSPPSILHLLIRLQIKAVVRVTEEERKAANKPVHSAPIPYISGNQISQLRTDA